MTEATERSKLSRWLRQCNAMVIPQVPSKYGAFGVPDLLILHKRWKGFIETKVEGNCMSPAQNDIAKMSDERGFPVACVTFLQSGLLYVFLWPGNGGEVTDGQCAIGDILEMLETLTKESQPC